MNIWLYIFDEWMSWRTHSIPSKMGRLKIVNLAPFDEFYVLWKDKILLIFWSGLCYAIATGTEPGRKLQRPRPSSPVARHNGKPDSLARILKTAYRSRKNPWRFTQKVNANCLKRLVPKAQKRTFHRDPDMLHIGKRQKRYSAISTLFSIDFPGQKPDQKTDLK